MSIEGTTRYIRCSSRSAFVPFPKKKDSNSDSDSDSEPAQKTSIVLCLTDKVEKRVRAKDGIDRIKVERLMERD